MNSALLPLTSVRVGTFDECTTTEEHSSANSSAKVRVSWAVPPEVKPPLAFRQMTINLPARDVVHGLGDKAFCHSSGSNSAQAFILKGATILEVFADTCGHAQALAAIATDHL